MASQTGAKSDVLMQDDKDAPANTVIATLKNIEPPSEKPENIRLRSYVFLSFWAIIVLVGLPI
jgi:hypothetical protein